MLRVADLLSIGPRLVVLTALVSGGCAEEPATQGVRPVADAGSPGDPATTADGGSNTSIAPRDAGAPGDAAPPGDAAAPSDAGSDAGPTGQFSPFPTNGQPIAAREGVWTYLEFPDTACRDGSPAGIAVSLSPRSKKVMIYLEGGGACFDAFTCAINPANTSLMRTERTDGVFSRENLENPVRDWNFVYVPYCTGDTHGGARPDATVEGVRGRQQFVGYLNMQKFLQRIVPTFRDATDVLLTGVSAGGFGTAQNAVLVQRAFDKVKVKMIDDSGPPLSRASIPECLQKKWRTLWNFDETFLRECGASCPNSNDFSQDYGLFLAKAFQDRPSGLISSDRDSIIAGFFGAGLDNCTGTALLTPLPAADFQKDLLAYREKVRVYPNFGTYFPASFDHTWIGDNGFFSVKVQGVRLLDWFGKIVGGQAPGHVGP